MPFGISTKCLDYVRRCPYFHVSTLTGFTVYIPGYIDMPTLMIDPVMITIIDVLPPENQALRQYCMHISNY